MSGQTEQRKLSIPQELIQQVASWLEGSGSSLTLNQALVEMMALGFKSHQIDGEPSILQMWKRLGDLEETVKEVKNEVQNRPHK